MTAEKPGEDKKLTIDTNVPEVYANNVQIFGSLFDFLFSFGVMTGPHGSTKPVLNLRMSPQHTKMFCEMLKTQVAEFEKSFAKLRQMLIAVQRDQFVSFIQ